MVSSSSRLGGGEGYSIETSTDRQLWKMDSSVDKIGIDGVQTSLIITLPGEAEARLAMKAKNAGVDLPTYVERLLKAEVSRPSLDEALKPVRDAFEQSGMTEEDLSELLRTVEARDGDRFKAVYVAGGNSVRLEGVLNSDGTIECIPTEVLKGRWEADILKDQWTGTIEGENLTFGFYEGSHQTR
jgi:hypothetical protein